MREGVTVPASEAVEVNPPVTIDEYLRKRLMPVEGTIPQLNGIEMYGSTIPAARVGGDVFEYINFKQRYNIEARIARAQRIAKVYQELSAKDGERGDEVDAGSQWFMSRLGCPDIGEHEYMRVRSSEQLGIAENLRELAKTAGVLLVDAQGHGVIAAKIASTVHDTLHAFMMAELDRCGTITPLVFEQLNLRLAHSATARNALGRSADASARELATLLYGEIRSGGQFRFFNFGHPAPLVFSAKYHRFMEIGRARIAQFLALGLEIPEDHPDRNRYIPLKLRKSPMKSTDMAEITLMGRGDILFLYTDGVYDGNGEKDRSQIEAILGESRQRPAKEICSAILDYAVRRDEDLRRSGREDEIDDKTVFIIKRT